MLFHVHSLITHYRSIYYPRGAVGVRTKPEFALYNSVLSVGYIITVRKQKDPYSSEERNVQLE